MAPGYVPPGYPPVPPKQGMGTGTIILIVVLVLIVPMIGIFAVLGIYGTRKYIANAKTAEARNSLSIMAKDAVVAYEANKKICPSASTPVPADRNQVRGKKYQSTASEWQVDRAADAGFSCLKFEMSSPQYFQYEYQATATGFVARAHGDLNGDGVFSTFEIEGKLVGDELRVSPSIREENPEE